MFGGQSCRYLVRITGNPEAEATLQRQRGLVLPNAAVWSFKHSLGRRSRRPSPMSKKRKKKGPPKRVLALPDLEQSKAAVLNSLTSKSGQRTYDRAITDFVDWYCSEPRLAFNRTVVLRYRIFLEQKQYAQQRPSTFGWRPCDGLPLRRPTPACSVRSWPPEFGE